MKNIYIVSLTVIVIAVGVLLAFGSRKSSSTNVNTTQVTNTPAASEFISSKPDTTTLKADGTSYIDTKGVFTFFFPNDYTVDSQNNDQYTRISKRGPTQKGQTEMYDGVIVVFESLDLQGKSLSEFVDTRIQESTADGTSELTQPKKTITLHSYPGYTYEIRGLGTSTYLVVQKNTQSNNAVSITFLVADPENMGFQQEVDTILATLALQK